MKICLVGGGVVGIVSAYYLARDGHTVDVIEAHDSPAQETSLANGAQLSYSYVAPLADPSVLPKLAGWILRPTSPMRFMPHLDWHQWAWCLAFLRACQSRIVRRNTAQLFELGQLSRRHMHELLDYEALNFNHQKNGKLVIYREADAYANAKQQLDFLASLGAQQQALDAHACVDLEPALTPLAKQLAGGIYTPGEETGDCHAFTVGLARAAAEKYNVRFHYGQRVTGFVQNNHRISAACTNDGDIQADAFVVAAGINSQSLLSKLRLNLALYPLVGYSLTAPIKPDHHRPPRINITDLHHKLVYAPLGDQLRVAGMVDLVGRHIKPDPRRIALLKRQAAETFPNAADFVQSTSWCGARPATPDSMPIIGATPYENLWLNVGHGALGFTLACGSAALLADLIAARPAPLDPSAFAFSKQGM